MSVCCNPLLLGRRLDLFDSHFPPLFLFCFCEFLLLVLNFELNNLLGFKGRFGGL